MPTVHYLRESVRKDGKVTSKYLGKSDDLPLAIITRLKASHKAENQRQELLAKQQIAEYEAFRPHLRQVYEKLEFHFHKALTKLGISRDKKGELHSMNQRAATCESMSNSSFGREAHRDHRQAATHDRESPNTRSKEHVGQSTGESDSVDPIEIDFLTIAKTRFEDLFRKANCMQDLQNPLKTSKVKFNSELEASIDAYGDSADRILYRSVCFIQTVFEYNSLVVAESSNQSKGEKKAQNANMKESSEMLMKAIQMMTDYQTAKMMSTSNSNAE